MPFPNIALLANVCRALSFLLHCNYGLGFRA